MNCYIVMQRQTTVTAYFSSKQLLMISLALQSDYNYAHHMSVAFSSIFFLTGSSCFFSNPHLVG